MQYTFYSLRDHLSNFLEFDEFYIEVNSIKMDMNTEELNILFQAVITFITTFDPILVTFLCQSIQNYQSSLL